MLVRFLTEYFKGFFLQLQFLTTLPLPINIQYTEKRFSQAIIFYPYIGLIIGSLLALVYYIAMYLQSPRITAVLIVFAGIMITGGLHIDGLADTCDGLFSYRTKEQILTIMKDSRIGVQGVLGIIMILGLKFIFLLEIKQIDFRMLLFLPVISRTALVWNAGLFSYAGHNKSPAFYLINQTGWKQIIISSMLMFTVFLFIRQYLYLIVSGLTILLTLLLTYTFSRKINGITGDVLGAMLEISETISLFLFYFLPLYY